MNLTGKQRRRIAKLLRTLAKNQAWRGKDVPCASLFLYTPCDFRDARRIGKMGLACPVITKWRPWKPGGIGEMALYPTREDAATRYPSSCIFPRMRRGA